MQYRILGPLEVVAEGRPVPLGTAKQRLLLAVLLLHPNEVVSRERLVDELWGERPPASAWKALQVYASQLRRLLPAGEGAIVSRGGGYVFEVVPERLDAVRFQRLEADARERQAAGNPAEAVRIFEEALALWRGPPLAGISFES